MDKKKNLKEYIDVKEFREKLLRSSTNVAFRISNRQKPQFEENALAKATSFLGMAVQKSSNWVNKVRVWPYFQHPSIPKALHLLGVQKETAEQIPKNLLARDFDSEMLVRRTFAAYIDLQVAVLAAAAVPIVTLGIAKKLVVPVATLAIMAARDALPTTFGDFANMDTNRVTGRGSLGKRIMGLKVEYAPPVPQYSWLVRLFYGSPQQEIYPVTLEQSVSRNLFYAGTLSLLRAPFPICTIGVLGSVFAGGKMMTSPVGKSIFDKATHTRVVSL
eukprot:TRINITY_DN4845_c0_g1_i2.p1 TRINITY_DN4845_c0_g1~~TRINITY_DN4845_c0_g1_i2.p1  ORF type:complete len:283 (-),score=44.68 TRINITY_DN4845_c0_g1_i2:4-825(-)